MARMEQVSPLARSLMWKRRRSLLLRTQGGPKMRLKRVLNQRQKKSSQNPGEARSVGTPSPLMVVA